MKKYLLCLISIFAAIINLNAQNAQNEPKYPFPQNVRYLHGNMTDVISNDFVKNWYDNWKKKYLQRCNNSVRPGVDPLSKSLVEAQGFAMVAVAYMGDKALFDSLYTYYKSKQTNEGCGLMGWKVNGCDNHEDRGSATDGDIDVACALIVADWQWPNAGYRDKAKALITTLKRMIVTCGDKLAVYPGCAGGRPWGGCDETDISYYTPAFFRYFAEVSGDKDWAKLADDTHLIRDAAANSSTGLVPDWQSVGGRAGAGSRKGYFSFDAIRAPYKQSMDFIWHGNEKAEAWAKKLTTWAHGYGVKKIVDGFNLNGTSAGSNHNMAAVGSMAVAAMANTQEVLDAFAKEVITLRDDYWYSGYLGNLYLLALTGNMWTPEIIEAQEDIIRLKGKPAHMVQLKITRKINRSLVISGIPQNCTVSLTSLSGKKAFSASTTDRNTTVNINSLQGGCYVLTLHDQQGKKLEGRMIPVY
jgi:endo-1,4-beta-D-glucanase Y